VDPGAFVDSARRRDVDLFVVHYLDLDLRDDPVTESGPCLYKRHGGVGSAQGLNGGKNILSHNKPVTECNGRQCKHPDTQSQWTYVWLLARRCETTDGRTFTSPTIHSQCAIPKQQKLRRDIAWNGCALSADGKSKPALGSPLPDV